MSKYVYPAIFTPEESGGYSVRFPDVKNCFTDGDTLAEALTNAEDALCLMLYDLEQARGTICKPTSAEALRGQLEEGEFVNLVACDTVEYRKFYNNRAVKKTLSIPAWLNEMAEAAEINFSGLLQEALKKQLNVN